MIDELLDRVHRLEQRFATINPVGQVAERDHAKGIRIRTGGTDDAPQLSPWIQPGDRTGASRYLPQVGEQVMLISHAGDWLQGLTVPFTHSDAKPNPASGADETVHHNRDGQRHSVEQGHVKDQADGKHSRFVGEDPGESASGGNFPHELNKQLQGLRAAVTQNAHNIAGLHDVTSQLREIAQTKIPQLASLIPVLNGDPTSLQNAAQGVVSKLEGYVAKTFEQMVGKLTNGLLDNIEGLIGGFMSGNIGGVLDSMQSLATSAGVDISGPMAAARGAVSAASGGSAAAMAGPLADMAAAFASSPQQAAFAALQGQMGGAIGAAASVFAGLGGLLDGQRDITKGQTKSYRLGGYGS